jgi:hypothetical protein
LGAEKWRYANSRALHAMRAHGRTIGTAQRCQRAALELRKHVLSERYLQLFDDWPLLACLVRGPISPSAARGVVRRGQPQDQKRRDCGRAALSQRRDRSIDSDGSKVMLLDELMTRSLKVSLGALDQRE